MKRARCKGLPWLPPPHPAGFAEETTYFSIVGELGCDPTIAAQCIFADPIADIAMLSEPDAQQLADEWDAFIGLTEGRPALRVKLFATSENSGGPPGDRTRDTLIKSQVLYH